MAGTRIIHASRTTAALLIAGSGLALLPRQTAWAEGPPSDDIPQKKPIYSAFPIALPSQTPSSTSPVSQPNPTNPTPTDRLAAQIRHLRQHLYTASTRTEDAFNNALTWTFKKETNLANTIASLAPDPRTGEQLLPGAIYVLVATLAGSIVSRNRGIFLRATFPLAVGIGAGWALIPVTMTNVGDLCWEYERRVPVVADTHLQIRKMAMDSWRVARRQSQVVLERADEATVKGREAVEGWVERGK